MKYHQETLLKYIHKLKPSAVYSNDDCVTFQSNVNSGNKFTSSHHMWVVTEYKTLPIPKQRYTTSSLFIINIVKE